MTNTWKNGVMGVVVGDALGCPVQFKSRAQVALNPIAGMRGYGTFNLPEGSWTDDSSMTLALLDSIREAKCVDCVDIMDRFLRWLDDGAYTPYGYAYDVGLITRDALERFRRSGDPDTCGSADVRSNGNGSLMRILPAALYCQANGLDGADAVAIIHRVGSLTHAHIRSNIACGLYFFMVQALLEGDGSLADRLQAGLDKGFAHYDAALCDRDDLECYDRLRSLAAFAQVPDTDIRSKGYVVDTLEAAVWSLITTDTFDAALIKAVNLGDDTDTVGAVAGGLAGLYYGYDAIPEDWLAPIKRREWIEGLCEMA